VTLRARLVVALVAVAAAIIASGAVIVAIERSYLVNQLDQQTLASLLPAMRLAGAPDATATVSSPPAGVPAGLFDRYVAAVGSDGHVLRVFGPGSDTDGGPVLAGVHLAQVASSRRAVTVAATGGTDSYRLVARSTATGYIVVASPLAQLDASVNRLMAVLGIAGLTVVGLLLLLGWWVVRLGLRPIGAITLAADAIAAGELDHRVDVLPATTEAGRLGRAFNLMLDERQASEERLRRFVADASHELRTPLTSISGYMSLYRRGELSDPARLDEALRRVGQEAGRMTELVEDLLLLAALDEGRPLAREPVDISQLLADVVSDAAAVHSGRSLVAEVEDHIEVRGDEGRLRQVFGALATNALVHNPSAAVRIEARIVDGRCVVDVEDNGDGMDPQFAAGVFQRFVRGDQARTRHKGGSGLGLAIVHSVVEAHGGAVTLSTAPGRGTLVTVVLPVGETT
jgi:two-component system OmpR family sensor kinase